MNFLFFLIVIVLVLVILVFLVVYASREAKKHGNTATEELAGICAVTLERNSQKEAHKTKILKLLKERGRLSNLDIRGVTGLHRRSAVRYMNELESEGKVEQIGETGRGVIYQLK